MYKNHNNFDVSPDALVAVRSTLIFSQDLDLYYSMLESHKSIKSGDLYYFTMTAREAVEKGWPCTVLDETTFALLNSHINPAKQITEKEDA